MKRILVVIIALLIAVNAYALTSVEIKSTGNATGVEVLNSKLMTISSSFLHQIMSGNIDGHVYAKVRGHSHSIGTADQEISALNTAGFGNWPSAAAGVVIVSDNAADAVAGTGATLITITGLDANWEAATTTVVPTGLTPTTATAQTFIRINQIEATTAGSELTNVGTITASISGTDIMEIYPEHSTSDAGRITIPADS